MHAQREYAHVKSCLCILILYVTALYVGVIFILFYLYFIILNRQEFLSFDLFPIFFVYLFSFFFYMFFNSVLPSAANFRLGSTVSDSLFCLRFSQHRRVGLVLLIPLRAVRDALSVWILYDHFFIEEFRTITWQNGRDGCRLLLYIYLPCAIP
jgi:hypothetical protein